MRTVAVSPWESPSGTATRLRPLGTAPRGGRASASGLAPGSVVVILLGHRLLISLGLGSQVIIIHFAIKSKGRGNSQEPGSKGISLPLLLSKGELKSKGKKLPGGIHAPRAARCTPLVRLGQTFFPLPARRADPAWRSIALTFVLTITKKRHSECMLIGLINFGIQ